MFNIKRTGKPELNFYNYSQNTPQTLWGWFYRLAENWLMGLFFWLTGLAACGLTVMMELPLQTLRK